MDPSDRIAVLRADVLSLAEDRRIRERWRYWHPWAQLFTRHTLMSLDTMRAIHHRTVASCLERGLCWDTIKRRRLDDPRLDDATRERKIQDAVHRLHKRRFTNADRT